MSFLDYKAKQIEPNAEHQAHHSKTEDLLVNEKSIFVVEYTKKKKNNNSGQSRGVSGNVQDNLTWSSNQIAY